MEQNQNKNNEVLAAITLALHEYQGYTMHVSESGDRKSTRLNSSHQ